MGIDSLHIINVAKDGTFQSKGDIATTPEAVDAIFQHLADDQQSHLVLYFHGGLVSEQNAREGAASLIDSYKARAQTHPIFWIWETDLPRVLFDNLRDIGQDTIFQRILDKVEQLTRSKLERDTGDSVTRGPDTSGPTLDDVTSEPLEPVTRDEEAELSELLASDEPFLDEVDRLMERLDAEEAPHSAATRGEAERAATPLSPEVLAAMRSARMEGEDEGTGLPAEGQTRGVADAFRGLSMPQRVLIGRAVGVFRAVVERRRNGTYHGLHATVSEEILRALYIGPGAKALWREMKRDAQQAFGDNEGRSGQALHGGTYFLERLRDYVMTNRDLKVSLVGHSAGTIYISEMLRKAAEILDDFQFHQIIFLAPAVDFELFKAAIVDQRHRFRAFRMFALSDELERKDVLIRFDRPASGSERQPPRELKAVYPSSLLYFVSGLLEAVIDKPLLGMQRFFLEPEKSPHQGEVVDAVRAFMASGEVVVWSEGKNAGRTDPGFTSWAESHGGFGEEPETLNSIIHLLTAETRIAGLSDEEAGTSAG